MASQKVAVYSLPDLKNGTDDALPKYLRSLKFEQSYYLTDVRLVLGYSAVVIAAATFAADYKLGWDATKMGTLWAVLAYFMLNGALTLWIWLVEKNVVFTGQRGGEKLSIASSAVKHVPRYNIIVTSYDSVGKEEKFDLSSSFTRWFDRDGAFIAKPFQQWLASELPIIGRADPNNVLPKGDEVLRDDGGK